MKAFFFAGVNGAGKTTLYYNQLEKKEHFGYRINIDEIVSSFGDWRNPKDQIRASKIALGIRERYINEHQSFNQETTLCGNSILRLFEQLIKKKYEIFLYYIGLKSAQLAKDRVAIRVKKGGHNIEDSIIEKRYKESFENLGKIIHICNEVHLFDNSEDKFKDIATIGKENIIHNQKLWDFYKGIIKI